MACQKINSTEVDKKIKAGISINNRLEEKNCLMLSSTCSRICIDSIGVRLKFSRGTLELEKRYTKENTSSSCIHTRSIDQGATRLGGL